LENPSSGPETPEERLKKRFSDRKAPDRQKESVVVVLEPGGGRAMLVFILPEPPDRAAAFPRTVSEPGDRSETMGSTVPELADAVAT
jgi:hypothetical protein